MGDIRNRLEQQVDEPQFNTEEAWQWVATINEGYALDIVENYPPAKWLDERIANQFIVPVTSVLAMLEMPQEMLENLPALITSIRAQAKNQAKEGIQGPIFLGKIADKLMLDMDEIETLDQVIGGICLGLENNIQGTRTSLRGDRAILGLVDLMEKLPRSAESTPIVQEVYEELLAAKEAIQRIRAEVTRG